MFGGNFLHGYDIRRQLRVYDIERQTRVPTKFRFPMYEHLHWYAAAHYIKVWWAPVRRCSVRPTHLLTRARGVLDSSCATRSFWLPSAVR